MNYRFISPYYNSVTSFYLFLALIKWMIKFLKSNFFKLKISCDFARLKLCLICDDASPSKVSNDKKSITTCRRLREANKKAKKVDERMKVR